ncbi:unnamed protein product [Mytilus coruscus]|uniref:Uncharacterized protein n=1 Tax=Mytilus coruscus TaxID=42192 RepID=A0A6J8DNN6_MYTCO|nr:unnamed protein product [Mytilus coruscus]
MSMSDTSRLIKESRRIVDASNDENLNSGTLLNMILEIVTGIDSTMRRMETNMEKRLDDLKQKFLTVSARVRTLENQASDFIKKLSDFETSCQGVSNLFDQVTGQVKTNRADAKQQYRQASLVRDRLYIDNQLYIPDTVLEDSRKEHTGSSTANHDRAQKGLILVIPLLAKDSDRDRLLVHRTQMLHRILADRGMVQEDNLKRNRTKGLFDTIILTRTKQRNMKLYTFVLLVALCFVCIPESNASGETTCLISIYRLRIH